MFAAIKKNIPESVKIKLMLPFMSSSDPKYLQYKDTEKRRIFVFLSGFYQNLGDMAITYAQKYFLQSLFPDAEVITVPSTETYSSVKTIKTFIRRDDLVTVAGGGNMDDMYVSLENARLHIVKSFPNNRIISFPQTVAFSDTEFGRKRQSISRKVYEKHNDLTIFVREKSSFEKINKAFPGVKIGFCPDIVLSLNKTEPRREREGILCCLRNDKELLMDADRKEKLLMAIKDTYGNVSFADTANVALEDCRPDTFEATLERFWDRLRGCRCVITDRLHCMIFCVITGTPCIVFDNSNHKISGVYDEWLRDVESVFPAFAAGENEILEKIRYFTDNRSEYLYHPSNQFDELKNICLGEKI